jgi:hypothetical protein
MTDRRRCANHPSAPVLARRDEAAPAPSGSKWGAARAESRSMSTANDDMRLTHRGELALDREGAAIQDRCAASRKTAHGRRPMEGRSIMPIGQ